MTMVSGMEPQVVSTIGTVVASNVIPGLLLAGGGAKANTSSGRGEMLRKSG